MCAQSDMKMLLNKIVILYRNLFKEDLCEVYLYGSYARGDYTAESDVDIAAIVKGDRAQLQEQLKQMWDIVVDLELDYEIVISPTVIPYTEFENYKDILPYYKNIMEEGVKLSA